MEAIATCGDTSYNKTATASVHRPGKTAAYGSDDFLNLIYSLNIRYKLVQLFREYLP